MKEYTKYLSSSITFDVILILRHKLNDSYCDKQYNSITYKEFLVEVFTK